VHRTYCVELREVRATRGQLPEIAMEKGVFFLDRGRKFLRLTE